MLDIIINRLGDKKSNRYNYIKKLESSESNVKGSGITKQEETSLEVFFLSFAIEMSLVNRLNLLYFIRKNSGK